MNRLCQSRVQSRMERDRVFGYRALYNISDPGSRIRGIVLT
jgi:hypothetical protein